MMDSLRWVVSVSAGVALAAVTWLAFLPWNLSETGANGQEGTGGLDRHWLAVVCVLGVVCLAGLAVGRWHCQTGTLVAAAGSSAWVVLFGWRSASTEASGANLWFVPFVVFVVPGAAAAGLLVHSLNKWLACRQRGRTP